MKKIYMQPVVNLVRTETASTLMVTSFKIDDKPGGGALVKDDDWNIWGDDDADLDE